jgi:hypothetical protein
MKIRSILFAGTTIAAGVALSSCAGRDAQPISTVQQQDAYSDCSMVQAEISANNQKAQQLANEQGMKVAQNVAAGVVGLVIWPVWFGMDFKGAAGQDAANLQARQQYLTQLAASGARVDIDVRLTVNRCALCFAVVIRNRLPDKQSI